MYKRQGEDLANLGLVVNPIWLFTIIWIVPPVLWPGNPDIAKHSATTPWPAKALVKELKQYAKNAEFFWCQEEPKNMGAWFSVRDYIQWTLDTLKANNNKISYIGRSPDATPATGYAKRHNSQQQEIINKVFN